MQDYDELASVIGVPSPIAPPKDIRLQGKGGLEIHGLDWGGSGAPCLLLHGGAMSAQTWTLCSLLLRERYHCVAIDLRGHGQSAWSDDYTISSQVEDIFCVVDQLGWSAPHLVGMSLGGVVAAHTVTFRPSQPPSSLTLVDVAPGVSFGDVARIRDFMASDLVSLGPEALTEEAERLGATQTRAELLHRYHALTHQLEDGDWTWRHDTRNPTDFPHILEHIAALDELAAAWTIPCLVVRGGRSRILSEDAARAFVDGCEHGQFATVANAGHSVQEDNPRDLAATLDQFWSGLTQSLSS